MRQTAIIAQLIKYSCVWSLGLLHVQGAIVVPELIIKDTPLTDARLMGVTGSAVVWHTAQGIVRVPEDELPAPRLTLNAAEVFRNQPINKLADRHTIRAYLSERFKGENTLAISRELIRLADAAIALEGPTMGRALSPAEIAAWDDLPFLTSEAQISNQPNLLATILTSRLIPYSRLYQSSPQLRVVDSPPDLGEVTVLTRAQPNINDKSLAFKYSNAHKHYATKVINLTPYARYRPRSATSSFFQTNQDQHLVPPLTLNNGTSGNAQSDGVPVLSFRCVEVTFLNAPLYVDPGHLSEATWETLLTLSEAPDTALKIPINLTIGTFQTSINLPMTVEHAAAQVTYSGATHYIGTTPVQSYGIGAGPIAQITTHYHYLPTGDWIRVVARTQVARKPHAGIPTTVKKWIQ